MNEKMHEQAVKELQNKLDEAEQIALKESMKDQQKLKSLKLRPDVVNLKPYFKNYKIRRYSYWRLNF